MRAALITPWDNAWIPHFKSAFERREWDFIVAKNDRDQAVQGSDVVLHGWSSGDSQPIPGAKNIFFLRRYELFSGGLEKVQWQYVDLLIVVNAWIRDVVEEYFKRKEINVEVRTIYNGTDEQLWRFKQRDHGGRIGMACHVHPKKNLPLALQVLAQSPEGTSLHIAGEVQDPCTAEYLNDMGKKLRRKVYLHGHIERANLNFWWEQMSYCLSTSISEGNPNNVIEAMAKGIMPVVHAWPGAEDQFPERYLFHTPEQAVAIMRAPYDSRAYREVVRQRFSLGNIEHIAVLAHKLVPQHVKETVNG